MKKLNRKGFTLIELLAVITIMGILMLVAIPAVSRTIENSRRDTFADVAKSYINAVRNSILADEFTCDGKSVAATGDGDYYFAIDSNETSTMDIMEQGGKSSWSNARVTGYVKWTKDTTDTVEGEGDNAEVTDQKVKTTYAIFLVDEGAHGIDAEVAESEISRAKVKTATKNGVKAGDEYTTAVSSYTECTLK
ncbi:MAG: type II secretion system protein [Bacilli bacterium]|nr:type II secretion system protein [Bacilli bacterium]